MNSNCTFEFLGTFKSYCNLHCTDSTLNTTETHDANEKCAICTLEMGEFHAATSMELSCCKTTNWHWHHKFCLRKMAYDKGIAFSCPWCGEIEAFQEDMLLNGIFIPSYEGEEINNDECANPRACEWAVNGGESTQPKAKLRRLNKNWLLEKTFDSMEDAMAAINCEDTWSYIYDNDTSAGKRITYRCNKVNRYF